jgi:hypothetical protein
VRGGIFVDLVKGEDEGIKRAEESGTKRYESRACMKSASEKHEMISDHRERERGVQRMGSMHRWGGLEKREREDVTYRIVVVDGPWGGSVRNPNSAVRHGSETLIPQATICRERGRDCSFNRKRNSKFLFIYLFIYLLAIYLFIY